MNTLIIPRLAISAAMAAIWCLVAAPVHAEQKAEKNFTVVVTDAQGVETEMKYTVFYWEEKLSETAFVPQRVAPFAGQARKLDDQCALRADQAG